MITEPQPSIRALSSKIQQIRLKLWLVNKALEGDKFYVDRFKRPEKLPMQKAFLESELNQLKEQKEQVMAATPKELWYPRYKNCGRNKGSNMFYDSKGNKYSQKEIDAKRSEAYRLAYGGNPHPRCEETGERAQCSSHIISQKRCKQLRKTELIWNEANFYPATYEANSRWESNDRTLKHYNKYMNFVKIHDPEGYNKRLSLGE